MHSTLCQKCHYIKHIHSSEAQIEDPMGVTVYHQIWLYRVNDRSTAANRPSNPGRFCSWILICFIVSGHYIYVLCIFYVRIYILHPLVRSVFAEMLKC